MIETNTFLMLQVKQLRRDRKKLLVALKLCQRLFKEALPKFNWANSALDANAIRLLTRTPIVVAKAIAQVEDENL